MCSEIQCSITNWECVSTRLGYQVNDSPAQYQSLASLIDLPYLGGGGHSTSYDWRGAERRRNAEWMQGGSHGPQ